MALYPAGVRGWLTRSDVYDPILAEFINQLQDEVTAVQTILGVNPHHNPSGLGDDAVYDDLGTRLDAIQNGRTVPVISGRTTGTIAPVTGFTRDADWQWWTSGGDLSGGPAGQVTVRRPGLYLLCASSNVYTTETWMIAPGWVGLGMRLTRTDHNLLPYDGAMMTNIAQWSSGSTPSPVPTYALGTAPDGSAAMRYTVNTSGASNRAFGGMRALTTSPLSSSVRTYAGDLEIYSPRAVTLQPSFSAYSTTNFWLRGYVTGPDRSVPANTWTRITMAPTTVAADVNFLHVQVTSYNWQAGDVFYIRRAGLYENTLPPAWVAPPEPTAFARLDYSAKYDVVPFPKKAVAHNVGTNLQLCDLIEVKAGEKISVRHDMADMGGGKTVKASPVHLTLVGLRMWDDAASSPWS